MKSSSLRFVKSVLATSTLTLLSSSMAFAVTWSDTSIGWRYGTTFAEPYKNDPNGKRMDLTKNIFNLTHSSGYTYGTNFFNVDLLNSSDEPSEAVEAGKPYKGKTGTQEAYVVYRNTLDLGKVFKKDLSTKGYIRGYGLTAGFDWNTKNDDYASRKRMFVVGPTVMFDVPGFMDLSVLAFFESNRPNGVAKRYNYDTHPAVQLTWGIPIANTPLSFEGYALWIAAKGRDEFGGKTKPETNIDAMVMYDLSSLIGKKDKTLRIGAEYQFWQNKFGNDEEGAAGQGATASTPMVRVDYHF